MILTITNITESMTGGRIGQISEKEVKTAAEALMRSAYILSGLEPPLYYDQLDDLATDLRTSFPHLTFKEVKLAVKAGVAGELGDVRRPSYAAIMRWTEAYNRHPQVSDARKIAVTRPTPVRQITAVEGLAIMQKTMPEAARRRWEDVRTTGSFGKATIPHVSAQLYDWLGEAGLLRLDLPDREEASRKARTETQARSVWNVAHLESGKVLTRSLAKHYALQTWMRNEQKAGRPLNLPQVTRIYE